MRLALALALAALAVLPASAGAVADPGGCNEIYRPAEQPPFGGAQLPELSPADSIPARFVELTPRDALALAEATDVVAAERQESPEMTPEVFHRGGCFWEVRYFTGTGDDRTQVAQVLISDPERGVLEAWRDHQVEVKLARGYDGAVATVVNSPWIWIPLCILFVAPFFDPRRPLRLVHLDLLAIVALSISLLFFNRGELTPSVLLVYPVIAYLFARMLWAGLRGRSANGPLVPVVPITLLALLAVLLAGGRIAVNVADSSVIDVGLAGVVGADRIEHGQELYEGDFTPADIDLRGDVYGPANYLAYVPFEQAFPWSGEWDDVPAAHAAAIAFDLLTALALLLAGRRLRPGQGGRDLGVVLAFAWLACPWTLYAMNAATNDALVALLVAGALAALSVPALRGALLALGTVAKVGPLALAPLFATATGERRWRQAAIFSVAFCLVAAAVVIPFLPDGGLRELYDRTFGYQASRGSPFSIWGLAPSLEPLQDATRVLAVLLGVAVAFYPARKSYAQIAALGAAVVIATQAGGVHWFYFYVLWFLPLVLVASFLEHEEIEGNRVKSAL
jgi:hypothetical protein